MNKNIQVSVIIPAHNAEHNLRECLDSVVNQTLKDIEIICVNDGSTDATESVIREYMKTDERVAVINQPNLYAGVARNRGMAQCHGKYMVFWDADDIFELNALEELYNKIEEDQADICVCNAQRYDDESGQKLKKSYLNMDRIPEELPFSIENNPQFIFNFTTNVPWNKMLKKSFVQEHGLLFQDLARANDQYFVMLSLALAKKITVVDKPLINYRFHSQTSLTSGLSNSPFDLYHALSAAREKMIELKILDHPLVQQSFMNRALNSITYNLEMQSRFEGFETVYNKMKTEGFAELGLEDRGNNFYYAVKVYEKFHIILNKSLEEFLFFEFQDQRSERHQISVKHKIKNAKYRELNEKFKAMRLEHRVQSKELKSVQKELTYIKNSRGYRMLQVLYKIKRSLFFWSKDKKRVAEKRKEDS